MRIGGVEVGKSRPRTHTTRTPQHTLRFCEAYARMLGLQGPSQSAQTASDGRISEKSRSDHKNGRNRRACRRPAARLHAPHPSRPACTAHHALQAHL